MRSANASIKDVERFSNLETGQSATIDAPLAPRLDRGRRRGRQSRRFRPARHWLRSRQLYAQADGPPAFALRHPDRPQPAHARPCRAAHQRRRRARDHGHSVRYPRPACSQPESFDVAVAAATLHHLRDETEWVDVFAAIYRALRPAAPFGSGTWSRTSRAAIQELMWRRYGEYLDALKGPAYRDQVYAYVEAEDTPRPLAWQLDKLRGAGFKTVEILHKNTCFCAFGGIK